MEAFLRVLGNDADALVKECIDNVQNFIKVILVILRHMWPNGKHNYIFLHAAICLDFRKIQIIKCDFFPFI